MIQILRVGLSNPTAYLKLLKSRFGQTLSLFCFYRLAPNRILILYKKATLGAIHPHRKQWGFLAKRFIKKKPWLGFGEGLFQCSGDVRWARAALLYITL